MRALFAILQFLIQHFAGLVLLFTFMVTGNSTWLYAINTISIIHIFVFAFGAFFTWTQPTHVVLSAVGKMDPPGKMLRGWRFILFTTFHVGSIMFFFKNDFYRSAIMMTLSYLMFWLMIWKVLDLYDLFEEESDE